jgi:hypothetical protein
VPEGDTAEAKRPRLVEFPGGGAEDSQRDSRWSERMGRSGRLIALCALLLVLVLVALVVQSRRIETLSGEIAALSSQVENANRQLAAYEAQRALVRDSLGGVLQELSVLHEVVSEDPLAVSEPAEAP